MTPVAGIGDTACAHEGSYDGVTAAALARLLGVPRLVAVASTTSTLDDAHRLAAEGAPSGTLVLADEQTAGRGRGGKRWSSRPGTGIWLALLRRTPAVPALDLLSIRLALAGAVVLEPFAGHAVRVKWPNDLWVDGRKLAGILIEARWRDGSPEWIAIGVGVNVIHPPGVEAAVGLPRAPSRLAVLQALVPALVTSLDVQGALSTDEAAELSRRDLARGRNVIEPGVGVADGITATGELRVRAPGGGVERYRSGSLVFQEVP